MNSGRKLNRINLKIEVKLAMYCAGSHLSPSSNKNTEAEDAIKKTGFLGAQSSSQASLHHIQKQGRVASDAGRRHAGKVPDEQPPETWPWPTRQH